MTAHRNVEALVDQARKFRPEVAAIADPTKYQALKDALANTNIEVAAGPESLVTAASRPTDWVMAAIVGAAGLAHVCPWNRLFDGTGSLATLSVTQSAIGDGPRTR